MAKASFTLDTETGKLDITVNGKKVENAQSVYIGSYQSFDYQKNAMKDKVSFEIAISEKSDEGVYKYTRLMAKQTIDGQEALCKGNPIYSKHDEFVEVSHSSSVEDEFLKLLR